MSVEYRDFIRQRIRKDLSEEKIPNGVVTRFPPEPNGHLHIGHAKAIWINFGIAQEFGGKTYLRFDDTNPVKEDEDFVEAIQEDIKWLGYDWEDRLTFASDYFDELYVFAEELIQRGKAFVCDLSADEIRDTRGSLIETGTDSPYRDRPVRENLDLFRRMRSGEFEEGSRVLRAKIDMRSPNLNMRDPVIYRILYTPHHRTGTNWCIYPMYDFTHCICDALENITHSLCSLEFEDHRPLYDWVLDNITVPTHPPQIEFSRFNLEYNVMSKRIFTRLIEDGFVDGWDDPRVPTIAGLRRRGMPPSAIREFCSRTGITKQQHMVEIDLLEFCVRTELESSTVRGMAVLDPLLVEISNYAGDDEELQAPWHPKEEKFGTRNLTFGRHIYIERSDFQESPEKSFRRLVPGGIVRLRYGFIICCNEVVKDGEGKVIKLIATYYPESRSGQDTSGLKPKGTIHFVSQNNAVHAQFRLYDRLFDVRNPSGDSFLDQLNPSSLQTHCGYVETALTQMDCDHMQFERTGYFCHDPISRSDALVFNQVVSLFGNTKRKTG